MLIEQLNIARSKQQARVSPEIKLNLFVDLHFDITGWYALGHHQAEKFLAAVVKQDCHANVSIEHVKWKWMIYQSYEIEIIDVPVRDSQPITLIEDWEECYCEECLG